MFIFTEQINTHNVLKCNLLSIFLRILDAAFIFLSINGNNEKKCNTHWKGGEGSQNFVDPFHAFPKKVEFIPFNCGAPGGDILT